MKNIDELSKELYDDVMSEYNAQSEWDKKAFSKILDDRLKQYNDDVSPIIMSGVYNEVQNVFKSAELPDVILKEPQLSDMLYKNKKRVQSDTIAILNDGIKAKKTIGSMSKKLYDGCSFNDSEVLQIRKKLPKYLQRELKKRKTSAEFIKYVDSIKTKPLKTALKQISDKMHTINKKGLENAIRVALEKKSRYYANRIADTEHHRAVNIARAKSYIDDDELEFVKHQMNSRHPMVDICDYYDKLDVGYGAGIYKKEDMIALPHHPHCRCRYIPHYDKVKKRDVKNQEKNTLERFSLNDRRNILGSHNKLQKFYDGVSVESIFNMSRPEYPVKKYTDVLGYNFGMQKFDKKFKKNTYGYEVGSISIVLSEILLSKTRAVTISTDTLKKNLKHHPDLEEDDYLLLDEIVGKSHFVAKDGDRTVAVVLNKNSNQLYHYALKSTQTGKALFLTSFRKTNKISIEKIRKKNKEGKIKILKDNLP